MCILLKLFYLNITHLVERIGSVFDSLDGNMVVNLFLSGFLLWFHQYLLITNFYRFRCWEDRWNYLLIEVQYLIVYCINIIIDYEFTYPCNWLNLRKIDSHDDYQFQYVNRLRDDFTSFSAIHFVLWVSWLGIALSSILDFG